MTSSTKSGSYLPPILMLPLNDVIGGVNEIAKDTRSYYSAIIGIKIDSRIALAAIGHVKTWLYRDGEFRTLLEPTIIPIPNEGSGPRVLTTALGVGFNPEKIQRCVTDLRAKEFVVIAFETELVKESTDSEATDDASQILDRLCDNITNKAPVVIVVKS